MPAAVGPTYGRRVPDYVIVGGGVAGCVLAHRLSEDPSTSVALVEAGPSGLGEPMRIPAAGGQCFRSDYDWDFDSHPDADGLRRYLPQGRVLGGSSAINGMVYTRGAPGDYDAWRQPGWSFAELRPFFLRAEDNERGGCEWHGTGGPLAVSDGRSELPSPQAFVTAAKQLGYAYNADFNGSALDGFGAYQVMQRDGERASAASAYLRPIAERANLDVLTGARALRLLVEHGRARGVELHHGGVTSTVRADVEVIVCCGSYNSPALLMRSGIGPADRLAALGIVVVADNPQVGQGLQDHPQNWLAYGHDEAPSLISAGTELARTQYARARRGPLASNGPESGGYVRTDPGLTQPDLQFFCVPTILTDGLLSVPDGHGVTFGASVLMPQSRGFVSITSPEPTAKPMIAPNYYLEPADLAAAVAGLRVSLDLARQPALRPYVTRPRLVPSGSTDDDLRAFARRGVQTGHHPIGTCGMGRVVDADLRVYGVEALRVVDASVMPSLIRGNTTAPVVAIAERAAGLIRSAA